MTHRSPIPHRCDRRHHRQRGYSLIELLMLLAIIGLISTMATTRLIDVLREMKVKRAIIDIRGLERQIAAFSVDHVPPDSLADLGIPEPIDPWGTPYQYLRIDTSNRGQWRKDRFLVPLNADYDLYSMGPDRRSRPPLTAAHSRDDIVRAGNGAYVGIAEDY